MRIIFSRNRPAQLDLLIRSLEQNAWREETRIIWYADSSAFLDGYLLLENYLADSDGPDVNIGRITPPHLFDRDVRYALAAADRHVTFFCDDDIVYRPLPFNPAPLLADEKVLTFSWRLGAPGNWWWHYLPRTDHGYPGSIDGHTFRTEDVKDMIVGVKLRDPNELEHVMAEGCEQFEQRPLMAAFPEQVLVSVPVNRVATRSRCPNGQQYPQSAAALNEKFLAGDRIDLDSLAFALSEVAACHVEVPLPWASRVTA